MNDQRKTIYIHIGLEKTGATSIQNYLFNHATYLQNLGVFYPIRFGPNQTALVHYSGKEKHTKSLYGNLDFKRSIPNKINEIIKKFSSSKCDKLLFSNEHLSSRLKDEDDIKNLHNLFSGYDLPIKIIVYIKNQVDMLESLYYESVKAGNKSDLNTWSEKFRYFELDYIKFLSPWENSFNKNNIIVKLFNNKFLRNGDAVEDFLNILGLQEYHYGSSNKNVSLGYKGIEFLRLLNSRNISNSLLVNNLLIPIDKSNKITMSQKMREYILDKCEKSNKELLNKYFNDKVSYEEFTSFSRPYNEQKYLTQDDILDFTSIFIEQIQHKNQQIKELQQKVKKLS